MSLQSDLIVNASKLKPEAATAATKQLNDNLVAITEKGPAWYEVGATEYRGMRERGETALPKPIHLPQAKSFHVPSREMRREIPCRLLQPEHNGQVKGVFLHFHGGGWVLMSEEDQDPLLQTWANAGLAVVSVGYRLAPEHPFPQGPEDCYDAAEWLVDNAKAEFGAPLKFVGGESAGGHLSALVALHLLKTRSNFTFAGLVLNCGMFDMSMLPLLRNIARPLAIINKDIISAFADAFLPNTTPEQRRDPSISPFYAELYSMKLPPALFLCGTEDCLLEDTVLMATRWQLAGGEAIMRLFAGASHGFIIAPPDISESAKEGLELIDQFFKEKLSDV